MESIIDKERQEEALRNLRRSRYRTYAAAAQKVESNKGNNSNNSVAQPHSITPLKLIQV
jgi:hypothetical protein